MKLILAAKIHFLKGINVVFRIFSNENTDVPLGFIRRHGHMI